MVELTHLSIESLTNTKGMWFFVSKAFCFKIGKARVAEAQEKEPSESVGGNEEKPAHPKEHEGDGGTITDSQGNCLLEDQ